MKFTIECDMPDRWVQPFVSMLKKMEEDGHVGHSEVVGIYSDGDGDFRPEFSFKGVKVDKWSPPLPDDYPSSSIFDADWTSERIGEWLKWSGQEASEDQKKHIQQLIDDGWEDMKMNM